MRGCRASFHRLLRTESLAVLYASGCEHRSRDGGAHASRRSGRARHGRPARASAVPSRWRSRRMAPTSASTTWTIATAADEVVGEGARGRGAARASSQGDVSRPRDADAMVARVASELGAPTILVNNAGVFPRVEFLAMTESDWDHVLDVNLKGSFLCAQAAARRMVEAGRGGAIVNLGVGRHARGAARRPLLGEQGRGHGAHARHGARPGAPPDPRQRHRAGAHGHRAAAATATRRRSWSRWAARSRWGAGWPRRRRSPAWPCSSRPRSPGWITGQTIHVNGGAFMGG